MTKQELREHLFNVYSANLAHCFQGVEDTFLCPFCLNTFGREAIQGDSKEVILAHCVQESLGGRLVTLACAGCDCPAGHEIDVHLVNRLQTTEFFNGTSPRSQRVWVNTVGQRVRADFSIRKGEKGRFETHIKIDGKNSPPGQWQEMKEAMVNGDALQHPLSMTQRGQMCFNMDVSRVALLRSAYLLMFQKFGYSYVLHDNLARLRQQFEKPNEAIVTGRPVVSLSPDSFPRSTVVVVTEPAGFNAFLPVLVFRTAGGSRWAFGVFMPGLDADAGSIYERLAEHQNDNATVGLKFATWDDEGVALDKPEAVHLPYDVWAGLRGGLVDAPESERAGPD